MEKHSAKRYLSIVNEAIANHQQQKLSNGELYVYYTTAQKLELARLKKQRVVDVPSSSF